MDWTRFEIIVAVELHETVADFFIQQGADGVALEDEDTEAVAVIAYFPSEIAAQVAVALEDFLATLQEVFPDAGKTQISHTCTPDENWAVAWRDNFKPVSIGRQFLITPPWLSPDPGHRTTIIIEPAEAFGTGTHETTQSCIVLLERAVDRLGLIPGQWTMLDVGCGSGIIAFAAHILGAAQVTAVDSDQKAVASAVENAKLNGIQGKIAFVCASFDTIETRVDVATANLDAGTLTTHSSFLTGLAAKALVVSGASAEQWPGVRLSIEQHGFVLEHDIVSEEWASGLFLVQWRSGNSR